MIYIRHYNIVAFSKEGSPLLALVAWDLIFLIKSLILLVE
jgi:hypothetical protein